MVVPSCEKKVFTYSRSKFRGLWAYLLKTCRLMRNSREQDFRLYRDGTSRENCEFVMAYVTSCRHPLPKSLTATRILLINKCHHTFSIFSNNRRCLQRAGRLTFKSGSHDELSDNEARDTKVFQTCTNTMLSIRKKHTKQNWSCGTNPEHVGTSNKQKCLQRMS